LAERGVEKGGKMEGKYNKKGKVGQIKGDGITYKLEK
jgi:hypothetical protein